MQENKIDSTIFPIRDLRHLPSTSIILEISERSACLTSEFECRMGSGVHATQDPMRSNQLLGNQYKRNFQNQLNKALQYEPQLKQLRGPDNKLSPPSPPVGRTELPSRQQWGGGGAVAGQPTPVVPRWPGGFPRGGNLSSSGEK